MKPITWIFETCGALYELLRLGILTRFNFKGPYWSWRLQTAFGRGYPASRRELIVAVFHHARWIHRMRRQM